MPRRQNSKRSRRVNSKGVNGSDPISTDVGRVLEAVALDSTNGENVFMVHPQTLSARTAGMAQFYGLYRLTDLKITIPPLPSTATAPVAFGVMMLPTDITSSTPLTYQNIMECPFSCFVPPGLTTNSTVRVPRSALSKTVEKWFCSELSSADNVAEYQCTIFIKGVPSEAVSYTISYRIEFSSPVGSAVIPKPITIRSTHASFARRISDLEDKLALLTTASKSPGRPPRN